MSDESLQRWGRLGFIPPEGMTLKANKHGLRYTSVVEVSWPAPEPPEPPESEDAARSRARDEAQRAWEAKLAELRQRQPPRGVSDVIVETRTFSDPDLIHAGVLYHHAPHKADSARWLVLAADLHGGVWVSRSSKLSARELLLERVLDVARAYQNPPRESARGYHLGEGLIALPYLYTEDLYLELCLEPGDASGAQTLTIHAEVIDADTPAQPHSLDERTTGVIASGFAAGVSIDRLAGGPREVAGMAGEELTLRVDNGGERLHNFLFEYPGRVEAGDWPKLRVDLSLPAGDLDQQSATWAALLDSFTALERD